jgi:hypothetical protein
MALIDVLHPSGRRRSRCPVTPELMSAHQLYQNQSPSRWEVEARILAGQTDDEVAFATGLPPAVVAAFEEHFFNVRDHLAAGDYILFGVIDYDPLGAFREGDLRTLWGYFGYAAGPRFLELVLAVSQDRPLPAWAIRQAPDAAAAEQLVASLKLMLMASTGTLTLSRLRKLRVLQSQLSDLAQKPGADTHQSKENVRGSTDCFGLGDLIVGVEAPAPAASQTDSGDSASEERQFAAVA